jgi:hypothetical protein
VRRDQLTVRPDVTSADPPVERKSHSSYGGWHRDMAGPPTRSAMGKPRARSGFRHTVATVFQPCLAPGGGTRGLDCGSPAQDDVRPGLAPRFFATRRADRAGFREGVSSWIELESFGSEASSPAPF